MWVAAIQLNSTPDQEANLAQVSHLLLSIANGHPSVLSSNMADKLEQVKRQIEYIRKSAQTLPQNDPVGQMLLQEAEKNEQNLAKLDMEGQFNARVLDLKEALRQLIRGIGLRETHGLNAAERQELFCNYVSPAESAVQAVITQAKAWYELQDAWLNSNDFWAQRKLWENRNEQLRLHWERLKKTLVTQDDRSELRLDDSTKQLLGWLEKEYKLPPGYWKNPSVAVKSIDGSQTHLQLWYYVDNIRLEHDSRSQRVRAELSRIIQERLLAGN